VNRSGRLGDAPGLCRVRTTRVDDLKARCTLAQARLDDLRAAGDERQESFRVDLELAWNDLEAAIKQLGKTWDCSCGWARRRPEYGPRVNAIRGIDRRGRPATALSQESSGTTPTSRLTANCREARMSITKGVQVCCCGQSR